MQKVKIYDFDKTLIRGDSIRVLIEYGIAKGWYSFYWILGSALIAGIKFLFGFQFERFKSFFVQVVEHLDEEQKKEFVSYLLRKEGHINLIETIKEDGYLTILCSASLEGYMTYVADELAFDYLLCTRHKKGKVIGKNNTRAEKKRRLLDLFEKQRINVDYENSKSYTDSVKNDFEMCSLTKNRYLVNSDKEYDGFINVDGRRSPKEKEESSVK